MPLTAADRTGTVIDSTACSDNEWASIHKVRSAQLVCRDCEGRLVAKVSRRGLRFFAHHVKPQACHFQGESADHRALKSTIADLVRRSGAEAVLEAMPADDDTGGWRADVLGIAPDGRRIAFEVQLAAMTIDVGQERTRKYAADGITTVWISTKHASWMTSLPSARLVLDGDSVRADRGLARFDGQRWEPAGSVDFTRVVGGLLSGRIRSTSPEHYYSEVVGDRFYSVDAPVVLVSEADWARRQRLEDERARRAEQHRRNTLALQQRQERVLQTAVQEAKQRDPGVPIWLGVPPELWDGTLPVSQAEARGNEATASGGVLWTGAHRGVLTLWAVVCPVASRLSTGLGYSWRRRNVRVYAETAAEVRRIAHGLGWSSEEVHLVTTAQAGASEPAEVRR